MKPAEVDDFWRHSRTRKRALSAIGLGWRNISRLSDNEIIIDRRVSIICGENGVGKSTILHTLLNALVDERRRGEAAVFVRADEGEIDYIRLTLPYGASGAPHSIFLLEDVRAHFISAEDVVKVALFDPAMHVPIILNAIARDANFAEVIEPLGAKSYEQDRVDELSFAVGRDYEAIRSYEIEGYGGLGIFPYFIVKVNGVEYGSEAMGFGELSLLLAYWTFSRMPIGSIVLMEEPETFVSPKSQRRIIDLVVKFSVDRDLTVVATTHSPAVVSRFARGEITLVSRVGHEVTLTNPVDRAVLEKRLDLVRATSRVWMVEDASAARTLSFFLKFSGIESFSSVLIAGNNDAVIACSSLKAFGESALVLGVLDGDERERRGAVPDNVVFLPGDVSPEILLRNFAITGDAEILSSYIAVTPHQFKLALSVAAGEDPHQWIHAMRADLDIPLETLFSGLLFAWSESNRQVAATFAEKLRALARA